nr:MAG TPA: hypothetical protein [Caudoviricetes sp.]
MYSTDLYHSSYRTNLVLLNHLNTVYNFRHIVFGYHL